MWLHVPSTSCPSAPASEESISESNSLPEPELSVMLSGKLVQRPLSWRAWKNRPWVRLLSGTISQPLTANRGAESWIASLRDSHVSRTPRLEPSGETTTREPSGQSSSESYQRCDPPWCSSKMSQRSLLKDTSEEPGKHYAEWVTRSKTRSSSVRQTLAHRIKESACSSWPTATAGDAANAANAGANRRNPNSQHHSGTTLGDAVSNWPTPRASPNENRTTRNAPSHGKSHGKTLAGEAAQWNSPRARDWKDSTGKVTPRNDDQTIFGQRLDELPRQVAQWETPSARDWKGAPDQKFDRGTRGAPLNESAKLWEIPKVGPWAENHYPTPSATPYGSSQNEGTVEHKRPSAGTPGLAQWASSPQAPMTTQPGTTSSESDPTSPRRLNPLFSGWLMGLPEGWANSSPLAPTSFDLWATRCASLLQQLLSRS